MSKSATSIEGATKLCHIVKRANFDGYGFNLHSEKVKPGQYIGKVDENSPAEAAGLKEGDRIIEVNGVAIGNATHKQVVQRIKAISNEVRLLLVSEHGDDQIGAPQETATITNGNNGLAQNDADKEFHGTKLEMPGASANISSISMVATKRPSETSTGSSAGSKSNGRDEMDNASMAVNRHNGMSSQEAPQSGNTINNITNTKKSESALDPTSSSIVQTRPAALGAPGIPVSPPVVPPSNPLPSPLPLTTPTTTNINNNNLASMAPPAFTQSSNGDSRGTASPIKAGSLELPTTAAEMRAKLLSKKKYDPKSEGVDLKKKFEIIQKL